jgi:hypothetical protein
MKEVQPAKSYQTLFLKKCTINKLLFFVCLVFFQNSFSSYRFHHYIFPKIIKHEGAVYHDHGWDPGGATKYGITLRTYNSVSKKKITKEQLKNLSEAEAIKFYEENFWYKYNADNIQDDNIALAVILAQINLGPGRPNNLMEKMLNDFCDARIIPDSKLSDEDVLKLNNCKYIWPGYPYMLYYLYKDEIVKSDLWSIIKNGIKRRTMEGVHA